MIDDSAFSVILKITIVRFIGRTDFLNNRICGKASVLCLNFFVIFMHVSTIDFFLFSTSYSHMFIISFQQLWKTVEKSEKALFTFVFEMLKDDGFFSYFFSFQHFSVFFTMWIIYPHFIHFIKVVDNCGKL